TSGTTGNPKLAPMPQSSACATVESIIDALGIGSADACLVFTPLFHSLGLVSGIFVPLAAGGRSIYLSGFDPREFFPALESFRPTWFSSVPSLFKTMVENAASHRSAIEKSGLRFVRSAGAPLAAALAGTVEEAFCVPVVQVYGLSEAPAIACHPMNV